MKNYSNLIREKTTITPLGILEIGSCNGMDANTLKDEFGLSDDDVWVVEPNPFQIKVIERNYPKCHLIKNAIYNKPGKLRFNAVLDDNYSGSSSLLHRPDNLYIKVRSKVVNVDVITGKTLMEKIKAPIDLCKIDVEGATYEVLESLENTIYDIKSFHIESEHKVIWKDQKLYKDTEEFLIEKGFVQIYFKYVNNIPNQSDSIWVQKRYLK